MATMNAVRRWRGSEIFSYGFRPFFLAGALHAALMVALWVPWFLGLLRLPSALPPIAWHAHEMLFGYAPAIIAGFALTAVPNWTGRLPVVGAPLAGLFALWLAGRLAVAFSEHIGLVAMSAVALAFLLTLTALVAREILAAGNRRNLVIVAALVILTSAHAVFLYEVSHEGASTYGSALALADTVMLISLIGGRITPSFTSNWLNRTGSTSRAAPFGAVDRVALLVGLVALAGWVAAPALPHGASPALAAALFLAGALHAARQARWLPHRTLREPLVAVLHAAYAFVPVGFLLAGLDMLAGAVGSGGAAHAWSVGAVGLMTLAVMTRASRGHTGRELQADLSTIVIYAAMTVSAVARLAAVYVPQWIDGLLAVAAFAWVLAFAGFAAAYGPMLLQKGRSAAD